MKIYEGKRSFRCIWRCEIVCNCRVVQAIQVDVSNLYQLSTLALQWLLVCKQSLLVMWYRCLFWVSI